MKSVSRGKGTVDSGFGGVSDCSWADTIVNEASLVIFVASSLTWRIEMVIDLAIVDPRLESGVFIAKRCGICHHDSHWGNWELEL